MKILLAVPSPVEAAALVSLFEDQEWSVTLAGTGKAAIGQAETQAFDLVILDTELPQISGMNVLKHLRDQPELENVPVMLITPNADMGLLTALTILIALLVDFLFLPPLLMKLDAAVTETDEDSDDQGAVDEPLQETV